MGKGNREKVKRKTTVLKNQFGLMPGKLTMKSIFFIN